MLHHMIVFHFLTHLPNKAQQPSQNLCSFILMKYLQHHKYKTSQDVSQHRREWCKKKKIYKYTEQKSVYYQATHRGKYFVRIYGAFALEATAINSIPQYVNTRIRQLTAITRDFYGSNPSSGFRTSGLIIKKSVCHSRSLSNSIVFRSGSHQPLCKMSTRSTIFIQVSVQMYLYRVESQRQSSHFTFLVYVKSNARYSLAIRLFTPHLY